MALFIPIGAGAIGGGTSLYIYCHIFHSTQRYAVQSRSVVARDQPLQRVEGGWASALCAGTITALALKFAALDTLVPKQTQPRDIRHFRQFTAIVGPRYFLSLDAIAITTCDLVDSVYTTPNSILNTFTAESDMLTRGSLWPGPVIFVPSCNSGCV